MTVKARYSFTSTTAISSTSGSTRTGAGSRSRSFAYTTADTSIGGATLDEADDAFLARITLEGTECQYCRYGEPGVGERIVDLAAVDGGYTFAGSRLEGAEGDAWVGRVDAELALSWAETYGDGRNGGIRTLVADEGGLAFGGSTTVDRAGRGWIVRLAAEN